MKTDSDMRHEVERTANKFAARHIKPVAADADHDEPRFPGEIFSLGVEAGFDRFALPEEMGGNGFGPAESCALTETLARACAGHAMVFGIHAAAVKSIAEANTGTSNMLLSLILNSGRPAAVAIPQPISSDELDCGLRMERAAPQDFSVSGSAGLAVNSAKNGFFVMFATMPDGRPAALLLEAGAASFKLGEPEWALGLRAMPMAELSLEGHPVGETAIICEGAAALDFYFSLLRHMALAASSAAAGLMSDACERAMEYAVGRYQGGKMVSEHTHVRGILGAMSATASSSIGSLYHAAGESGDTKIVMAAKRAVTDCAVKTCTDAVQVLGGYGYMRDYGLEKSMRDAAVLSLLPVSNARIELLLASMDRAKY